MPSPDRLPAPKLHPPPAAHRRNQDAVITAIEERLAVWSQLPPSHQEDMQVRTTAVAVCQGPLGQLRSAAAITLNLWQRLVLGSCLSI